MISKNKIIEGEYFIKGEYHKNIDKKWKYFPVYIEKMRFIRRRFNKINKKAKIIDLGCGEGILVDYYKRKGYDIIGLDYNYSSKNVKKGDITKLNIKDNSFDLILALDVIEHLNYDQQEKAILEIKRILKKDGKAILALPNLSHFASRISMLFTGKLIRTSSIARHKGDRPISEYINLLKKNDLNIISKKGIFPTFLLISLLTWFFPDKVLPLHKIYNSILAYPTFCFLVIIEFKKEN